MIFPPSPLKIYQKKIPKIWFLDLLLISFLHYFWKFWLTVSIDLVLIIGIKLGGWSWNRLHWEMIFHWCRHTVWSCRRPIFSGSVHSNPNGCRWGHTWGWSRSKVDVWPRYLHICSAISSVSNKNKIAVYWSGGSQGASRWKNFEPVRYHRGIKYVK